MPASPTQAQSDASRANGARSAGPTSEAGKARSALNATRHNLFGSFRLLPHEDPDALHWLLADLAARHAPVGAVEDHWIEEIAFAMWRQRRLRRLELLAHPDDPADCPAPEGAAAAAPPRLPSPATLARYRARVERDLRLAEEGLRAARRRRPRLPAELEHAAAHQLRWLADRLDERAAASGPDADERHGAIEPEIAVPGGAAVRAEPAATDPGDAAGATVAVTNEPAAVPAPASRPLNRGQRRQLKALTRSLAA